MPIRVSYRPEEIAGIVAAIRTAGATSRPVTDIASLAKAGPGDLTFLGNARYKADVATTRASVVLVPPDYEGQPAADQLYCYVENPSAALARLCARLEQALWPRPPAGVHPSAVVSATARIDPTAHVGPSCVVEDDAEVGPGCVLQALVFVGRRARVGEGCWLMPSVTVGAECVLAERVRLHSGVVIGSDGFGYEFVKGRHEKVPQIGHVLVGADVEIGANSAVDRARFGQTVIGEGTKIDNLVQVAHNVVVGRHCILCAGVGIAGSTTLGDYVVLGGQAGVAGHLTIGQGAKVGGQAGVTTDVAAGAYVNGNPAIPYMLERRIAVLQQKLPELFRRVDVLEKNLEKTSAPH